MEVKVWNKLLATGRVHDQVVTDEAMKQLRQQLVGTGVYQDYSGPRVCAPRKYTKSEREQLRTAGGVLIGHVEAVEGDRMTIVLFSDVPAPEVGEVMTAKADMLVITSEEEDGSIRVEEIREVLGVCLVKEQTEA